MAMENDKLFVELEASQWIKTGQAACGDDFRNHLFGVAGMIGVVDDEPASSLGQFEGDDPPESLRSAGDQSNFSCDVFHAFYPIVLVMEMDFEMVSAAWRSAVRNFSR